MNLNSVLLLVMSLMISQPIFAGGENGGGFQSGGGGGAVFVDNSYVLYDFYQFLNSNYKSSVIENSVVSNKSSDAVSLWVESDTGASVANMAQNIMGQWMSLVSKPELISALKNTKNAETAETVVLFYPYVDKQGTFSMVSINRRTVHVETAAYFSNYGCNSNIEINLYLWNKLTTTSKVGLIIHEKLRQLQLVGPYGINDFQIQKLTALMVACQINDENKKVFLGLIEHQYRSVSSNYQMYENIQILNCAGDQAGDFMRIRYPIEPNSEI